MSEPSSAEALTARACAAHQSGDRANAVHLIDAAVAVATASGDRAALERAAAMRELVVCSPSPPGPVWSVAWSAVKDGAPPEGVVAAAAKDPGGMVGLQAAFATAPGLRRIFEPLLREVAAIESQRPAPMEDGPGRLKTIFIVMSVTLSLLRFGCHAMDQNQQAARRHAEEGARASAALREVSPPAVGPRIDAICLKAPAVCTRVASALESKRCDQAWAEVTDAPADYHRDLGAVLEASCPGTH
ncbi:MAG: hypothetical protein K1X89_18380 [Myxococcaceae bacterium]|nr:hypothetical protein [Myxococcaceae bacterium]